jgi:hypothetical protein
LKNNTEEAISATNMLTCGATKTEVNNIVTWTFSGVFKADANGYLAIYTADGNTLIYTTATSTAKDPIKMDGINNFCIGAGADGSSGSFKISNLKVII